jgi:hypothetical protein
MSSVADRMRQHRARKARGRTALLIEVDEIALVEKLKEGGFISPHQADDRAAVTAATNEMIGTLLAENLK